MKKLGNLVTAAALLLSTTAFATDANEVNAKVQTAFQKDFSKAINVNWESKGELHFADFSMNNVKVNAVYNEDGELVATSRTVWLQQLPEAVQQSVKDRYSEYTVSTVALELNHEGQTSYYISAANGKHVLRLKADAGGSIEVESKTKL